MAIEKAKELIKTIRTDPKAQEALKGLTEPTDGGWIKYYAEAAKLLGYEVTEADILGAITNTTKERAEKTEKAAAGVQTLPDDELDQVAGGGNTYKFHRWEECDRVVGDYTEIINCYNDYVQGVTCEYRDACSSNMFRYHNFLPNINL